MHIRLELGAARLGSCDSVVSSAPALRLSAVQTSNESGQISLSSEQYPLLQMVAALTLLCLEDTVE